VLDCRLGICKGLFVFQPLASSRGVWLTFACGLIGEIQAPFECARPSWIGRASLRRGVLSSEPNNVLRQPETPVAQTTARGGA